MPQYLKTLRLFVALTLYALSINSHATDIDSLPAYQPEAEITGSLSST